MRANFTPIEFQDTVKLMTWEACNVVLSLIFFLIFLTIRCVRRDRSNSDRSEFFFLSGLDFGGPQWWTYGIFHGAQRILDILEDKGNDGGWGFFLHLLHASKLLLLSCLTQTLPCSHDLESDKYCCIMRNWNYTTLFGGIQWGMESWKKLIVQIMKSQNSKCGHLLIWLLIRFSGGPTSMWKEFTFLSFTVTAIFFFFFMIAKVAVQQKKGKSVYTLRRELPPRTSDVLVKNLNQSKWVRVKCLIFFLTKMWIKREN